MASVFEMLLLKLVRDQEQPYKGYEEQNQMQRAFKKANEEQEQALNSYTFQLNGQNQRDLSSLSQVV